MNKVNKQESKNCIENLIVKSLFGSLSTDEQRCLEQWRSASYHNHALYNRLLKEHNLSEFYREYSKINSELAWKNFKKSRTVQDRKLRMFRYAAAVILPFIALSGLLIYNYKESLWFQTNDIIYPGCSQATLLSNDGRTLFLLPDTTQNIITDQDYVVVQNKGELSYLQEKEKIIDLDTVLLDNTLFTQNGGEYRITLADGTRVHLNYNTKLKYPVAFGKSSRVVYLEGEAFFDVAPDPNRPFYVITRGMKVKQYGTSFNVNDFSPNETSVVLVEGSISLLPDNDSNELLLKPGQRAVLNTQENNVCVDNVNVEAYTSWNSGYFNFEDESLEDIMQSLSQWYNIDVNFESDDLKKLHFTGTIDRYSTINPILKAISRTVDVKIRVSNKTVTISS